ncbi:hypothetical protein NUACC21_22200 [Scytonema sp. NUACC21]
MWSFDLNYYDIKQIKRVRLVRRADGYYAQFAIDVDLGSTFRQWLEYFGHKYGSVTVAVPPHNTSQNCSNCGAKVKKSLSTRTHVCHHCAYVEDRDINASINILKLGLSTVGHTGTYAS